jgi:hypothetical protein
LQLLPRGLKTKVLDLCIGGLERLALRNRMKGTSQAKREPVLRRLLNDVFKPTSWCGAQNPFELLKLSYTLN